MRKTAWLASVLLLSALTTLAASTPAKVTIGAAAKKQPAVAFAHAEHTKRVAKCDTCHHDSKGLTAASTAAVKKCSTCHLDPKDKAPSMREMSLTKNPFHSLCIGCHKAQKKGATKCTDCHKK